LPPRLHLTLASLHALYLYGAAAVAAFGWAICALLGVNAAPWLPLWFCAALLIYNVDRLRAEPADALNLPLRTASMARLRGPAILIAAGAGAVLLILPILRQDWRTLALALGGALVCLNYSIPVGGFRLRDVPLLKSFIAPTVIVAAILGLPVLHGGAWLVSWETARAAAWAWCYLLFNTLLCDLRDLPGDRACGVASLAVRLGARRTVRVLAALILALAVLALIGAGQGGSTGAAWAVLACAAPVVLIALVVRAVRQRSERFYEWCVEGMLFLPALVVSVLFRL
jgi:4-hydroxybenzoate polyprenyltransferase